MKRWFVFSMLLLLGIKGFCQPQITNITYPTSVGLFGLYEISFSLGSYINPYDPQVIDVYAVFSGPDNSTHIVNGFYYEGYTFQLTGGYENATAVPASNGWRIRFTPEVLGGWTFAIHAKDSGGETIIQSSSVIRLSFTCLPVTEADGFISVANTRFLKRDVVRNGQRNEHSFFPVGPNIAWYDCQNYDDPTKPFGIYDYEKYIDSLDGRGNYMRVWINRFRAISLFGPEYTQPVGNSFMVYFNNTINQKDAAELDHIISYASQKHVAIMLCFFTFGCFKYLNDIGHNTVDAWENNPFSTILDFPCQFFSDTEAKRITCNLIRYIVARWGYATNIMNWELWNEVTNMSNSCSSLDTDIYDWHEEMIDFITENDPFNHCISTSMSKIDKYSYLYSKLFGRMDFVQNHNYQNIQKANSKSQFSKILLNESDKAHADYPSKPFFMGEFGFGQEHSPSYYDKDPYGFDLHNSLWSSLFSTSMGPASFWWWNYACNCNLFGHFKPLLSFCDNLPILSDSFLPYTTGVIVNDRILEFENSIETYYMKNTAEDTIYGWSQDTAFAYQSLRWLTDRVQMVEDTIYYLWHFIDTAVFDPNGYVYTLDTNKKPQPSSNSNIITIPITSQPVGTRYIVRWYDTETGLLLPNPIEDAYIQQNTDGTKKLSFSFPSSIRNLTNHSINNKFGDAIFRIIKYRELY